MGYCTGGYITLAGDLQWDPVSVKGPGLGVLSNIASGMLGKCLTWSAISGCIDEVMRWGGWGRGVMG